MLMPTPTALSSGAASKTRQAIPARCSISPSVNPPMPAPIMRTSICDGSFAINDFSLTGSFQLREGGAHAPGGDGGQPQRYQHVPAGERKAEEAPGDFVAAHDADVVQPLEDVACGAKLVDRPGAVDRPLPPLPFDARMLDRETAIPEHEGGDYGKARDHDLI